MLEASEEVRRSPLGQRLRLGRTRIGIETGPAIVGDVGGSRKLDYTAHGNAINAAARLEAANKDLGSSICIGPGTAARLDPAMLRRIGTLTLRGQSQGSTSYAGFAAPGEGGGDGRHRKLYGSPIDGGERAGDARRPPGRGAVGSAPGRAMLVPSPLVTSTAVFTARHQDRAALDEHAENPVAGAGEEARAAHRDQAERTRTRPVLAAG